MTQAKATPRTQRRLWVARNTDVDGVSYLVGIHQRCIEKRVRGMIWAAGSCEPLCFMWICDRLFPKALGFTLEPGATGRWVYLRTRQEG